MATLNLSSLQNLNKTEENSTDVQVISWLDNNVIIEEKPQEEKPQETRKPLISLWLKKNVVEIPKEEIQVEIKDQILLIEPEEDKKEESQLTDNNSIEKTELVTDNLITDNIEIESVIDLTPESDENEEKISPKISIGAINLKNKEEEQVKIDAWNIETKHEDVISIVSWDTFKEEVMENKEFFTNFNIEDEFRMDELLPKNIITTEIQSTTEEIKWLSIEPKKEEVEIIAKEEIKAEEEEIKEDKKDIIEPVQEIIKEEEIKAEEKIEENSSKDVDQIKKELSSDRKPAWVNSFKRKIIVASFGVFALASISIGLFLWWDMLMNGWKINIKESTWSSVDNTVKNNNNSNVAGTIISSWTDFKIIKNTKKNIKRIKTSSWVVSDVWVISDNTWTLINTWNTLNTESSNSWNTNSGTSDENKELIDWLQWK